MERSDSVISPMKSVPDWYLRFNIPRARGKRARYLAIYRRWLDRTDPHHHLHPVTQKDGQRFIRLCVTCKPLNINIQDQFVCSTRQTEDQAYALAMAHRRTLPDELFCMRKRSEPEVPGVYCYPMLGYKGDISNGVKRLYCCFSFARYTPSEAYDRAVKSVFDAKGIDYPKSLFKALEAQCHG